ncbi:hypothetical protein L1987_38849 [Smallanthus sonchifolius]|uniref:Uncharacterized protein n=1 Tax=Smallanthus sonchifolius TaxID=185202 RepID=A0ACB9HK50_9ASTR|nr:hypothetical protein L1987_38849 [Smallanthus sonchifolius]
MNSDTPDAEDTAFYAQLTRQILLLMDEDDVAYTTRTTNGAPELGWTPVGGGRPLIYGKHFGWLEGGRSFESPSWMESMWENNGGGTGVFIPRVAVPGKPRRKRHHKSRKNKNGIDSSAGKKIQGVNII